LAMNFLNQAAFNYLNRTNPRARKKPLLKG
jgi:hypothetical protein